MRVLVAGATGKVGIRLVKELASRGHHPVALVRESSDTSALAPDVELRQGEPDPDSRLAHNLQANHGAAKITLMQSA